MIWTTVPQFRFSMREDQLNQLRALLYKWRAEAMKGVPDAYRSRGMAYKYLRGDNYEGGLYTCADELEEMLLSETA